MNTELLENLRIAIANNAPYLRLRDTAAALVAALDAAQAPPAELAVPADAVWLMPNATDKPADGRLMHYAWGRSKLTTGQMAEAYQCIVSAAQACGQVCTPPAAPAVPADNVTPMRQPRADLARLVESINAAVYANGDGLSVTEAIGALELAKLELLKEQEQ